MNKPIGAYTRVSQKSLKKVAEKRNKRVKKIHIIRLSAYGFAGFVAGLFVATYIIL